MAGWRRNLFTLLMLLGLAGSAQAAFDTSLTDNQLQDVLQGYFPLREYAVIARINLQVPRVILEKGREDIILYIPVDANIIGDTLQQGHVVVAVGLNYQSSSGGLYLGQPRVQQFSMPGVDSKVAAELREYVVNILRGALSLVQIYTVKEQDLNHSLAKSALKQFSLEDGRLQLEFGFQ